MSYKDLIEQAIEDDDRKKALKLEAKRQAAAKAAAGGHAFPNVMSYMSIFARTSGKKKDKEPDKPDDPTPDPPLTPTKPTSNNWEDIVGHYFPKKTMKDGGLVRGGGVAQRGKGRGKMC